MEWWKNSIFLSWLSIILVIIGTFLGLYFQSEKFSSSLKNFLIKIKLYIASRKIIFITLIFIVLSIILFIKGLYIHLMILYALYMTVIAYIKHNERRNIGAVVSCILGNLKSEQGVDGLYYVPWEDGNAQRVLNDSEYVRKTEIDKRQAYIYFAIKDEFAKYFRSREIYIVAEYLDHKEYGEFHLHYDSTDRNHPNSAFKGTEKYCTFVGSKKWKTAIWKITDGNFRKSQQNKADFRFKCGIASSQVSPSGKTEAFDIYLKKIAVIATN